MTLEELSNVELIEEFRQASLEFYTAGAKGRSRYFAVEEELLSRLGEEEK